MSISPVSEDIFQSNDVAIIGSSKNLLYRKQGKCINQHTDIVRINSAPLDGFEEYVGNHTDIIFSNEGWHAHTGRDPTLFKVTGEPFSHEEIYDIIVKRHENAKMLLGSPQNIFHIQNLLNKDLLEDPTKYFMMDSMKDRIGSEFSKYSDLTYSTRGGIQLIILCLTYGIKPHVYGFDYIHNLPVYYDNGKLRNGVGKLMCVEGFSNHSPLKEMLLLRDLQRTGKIHIHKPYYLLDCTIRDGGYMNQWKFSEKEVAQAYQAVSDAGYDYFEIGFRDSMMNYANQEVGPFKHVTDNLIQKIRTMVREPCLVAVMVNQGSFHISDFKPATDSEVHFIRIAFHRQYLEEAFQSASTLRDKGYKIALNVMGVAHYTSDDITQLAHLCVHNRLYTIYIADSYGSLGGQEMLDIRDSIQKEVNKIDPTCPMEFGCHAHNNRGDALEKSKQCIQCDFSYIDTTLGGIGRGAGNLATENLVSHLLREDKSYHVNFEGLIRASYCLRSAYTKDPNLPLYCLYGHYHCHPNYLIRLLEAKDFCLEDCINLVKNLQHLSTRGIFSPRLLEETLGVTPPPPKQTPIIPKVLFLIPARLQSSRFPGKLLKTIGSRSIIERTYQRVLKSSYVIRNDEGSAINVRVVTDSMDIHRTILHNCEYIAPKIGVVQQACKNGTERCQHYMGECSETYDLIVNVQGDEPYVDVGNIDHLVRESMKSGNACTIGHYGSKQYGDPTLVKTVGGPHCQILYSSRADIPSKKTGEASGELLVFGGIYAFRPEFLKQLQFTATPCLEKEDIEHVGYIEEGYKIHYCILPNPVERGVNTPVDLAYLRSRYGNKRDHPKCYS